MLDDLEHVFRNISQEPVAEDVKTAFSRVLSHCEMHGDDDQRQLIEEFESFGKIVLLRKRPVKPFFHRKFAQSAMALSKSFNKAAA